MDVDRPRRLEHAAQFEQPGGHVGEIRLVAVRHGRQQHAIDARVLGLDEIDPLRVNVGERPCVAEFRPGRP